MILVTGATGFIGRSLTNTLSLNGYQWRAYNGRINAQAPLREQLVGIDTVFHLASSEARGRQRLLRHVDFDGTRALIEEAQRAAVRHIIFPSRIGADANSAHPLLRTKGEVERLLRASRIDHTILRSSTLFGLGDRFTEIILGLALWSWPFVWLPGGGEIALQPLWVEDFARCLVACLEKPELLNQTIELAGDERFRYRSLVTQILAVEGVKRISVKLPLSLLGPAATLTFGWWHWPAVSRFFVNRFFGTEVTELDALRRHFGFRPMRFSETMAYLHRPGIRWRIFRH